MARWSNLRLAVLVGCLSAGCPSPSGSGADLGVGVPDVGAGGADLAADAGRGADADRLEAGRSDARSVDGAPRSDVSLPPFASCAAGVPGTTGRRIAVDGAGNIYVTGEFGGTVTFGTSTLQSKGASDLYVAKYDPSCTAVWAVSAGGAEGDEGRAIALDSAGNIYITGIFRLTATFGAVTLTTASEGYTDLFVAKLDSSGKFVWATSGGGTGGEFGWAVAVDASGNSFVAGGFAGDSATFGSTTLTNQGSFDGVVAKLDPQGKFLWARSFGGVQDDQCFGVAADAAGNVYITGRFANTATFGSKSLASAGASDLVVAKLDGSGTLVWITQAGGDSNDIGAAIALDGSGNLYVAGTFAGTAGFGTISRTGAGIPDIFVAKLDAAGSFTWVVTAGNAGSTQVTGLGVSAAGAAYVTGTFAQTLAFGSHSVTGGGDWEIYVARVDPAGSFGWAVAVGNPAFGNVERSNGLALDSASNVHFTGELNLPITFGTHTVSTKGGFLAKLRSDGTW